MRVLVTGATGFIGSQLVQQLRQRGHEVVATGQCHSPIERQRLTALSKAGISVTVGPLQDAATMRVLIPRGGTVIHLAAAQHEMNVPDAHFYEVNVEGTRTLLQISREAGVQRFVYGSTIGVYGGAAPTAALDESSAPRPDNIYARTKLEAERTVLSFAPAMDVSIVRISETYGPGDMRLLKLFKAIARGRFLMIGSGMNHHQPIYVHDLIDGIMAAAAHPCAVGELFLLAGREPVTTREMIANVAAVFGRHPPRLHLPMLPFLGAATLMEAGLRPLGIQPPLHRRRLDFFRKSFVFSTAKAQRLLGFTPQHDIRSGIAETAQWYRSHGLLQEDRP